MYIAIVMKIEIRFALRFFFLLALIFLNACSDNTADDGPTEIEAASGNFVLTELNVNPPQDVNEDGTASTNLLNEMPCISGNLVLRDDGAYVLNLTAIEVTNITGGLFFITCSQPITSNSNWNINAGEITLFGNFTTTPYVLNGSTLTRTIGEDLPNIQSVVYQKQ